MTSAEILLIEDDPIDVDLVLEAVREGHLADRIEAVRDGEEALDYLFCRGVYAGRSFENPPRVVVLDLKLQKMSGLEVLRCIKTDPRTRAIPVVVFTNSGEERDLVESYNLAANAYIQKPVNFDQFRAAITEIGLFWLLTNAPPPPPAFRD